MDDHITLRSGQSLSYARYGDIDGVPLVAFHGSADSRLIWGLLEEAACDVGVCLIAADRPGFGASPYVPDRSTRDHADDVVELADHLGLGTFPIITISGGLVFGLAAAAAYPERINRVTSYAGMYLPAPGAIEEMNPLQRVIVKVSTRFPRAINPLGRLLFTPQVFLASRSPRLVFKMLRATRPAGDKRVLDRPDVAKHMIAATPSQFQSVEAVTEALATQQMPPFTFELAEIRQAVHVWQGGSDDVHTAAMGRHIADTCLDGTLHFFPDLATFDLDVHYPEMIRSAVEVA